MALEPFPEDWQRALAVVAHPDDLEYGTASAVARWTSEGRTVTYLLATRGEAGIDEMDPAVAGPRREAEERAGAKAVGVDTVEFLDHRDGVLVYGLDLRRDIARAIRRHRPELLVTINHHDLFAGGGLNQADHRVVGQALIDAARDAGNRWVFPELIDDGLEPWGGARWVAVNASPGSTHAVDVGDWLDQGVASLQAHRAYLDGLGPSGLGTDPAEFLHTSAVGVGEHFGGRPAVAFELLAL